MSNNTLMTTRKYQKVPGGSVNTHSHHYNELVYYSKGNGSTVIDGKTYQYSANQFTVIPATVEHSERHDSDVRIYCIGWISDTPCPTGLFDDGGGAIKMVVSAIFAEAFDQPPEYAAMLQAKLDELLILVKRNHCWNNSHPSIKELKFILNYINENYYEKLLFKELAHQLHYSYDYFRHLFKKTTGQSPQQYLLQVRLNNARDLLLHSDFSCTEIAQRCGFSNSSQFSKLFKQHYGVPPLSFRNGVEL